MEKELSEEIHKAADQIQEISSKVSFAATQPTDTSTGMKSKLRSLGFSTKAIDLFYWKTWSDSAIALFSILIFVYAFNKYRLHVVIAMMFGCMTFVSLVARLLAFCFKAIHKTEISHPFENVLIGDLLPTDKQVETAVCTAVKKLRPIISQLRDILLSRNIALSSKVCVLCFTIYRFNGFFQLKTIILLVAIILFSGPIIYDAYQTQIDENLATVCTIVKKTTHQMSDKLPPHIKQKLFQIGLCPFSGGKPKSS